MPRRSNEFQRLVHRIEELLAPEARVTESALLRDRKTGELREVDVLIEAEVETRSVAIGVDATARSRPADTTWVEQVAGKLSDLPLSERILVAKSGFTAPALQKAQALGLQTIAYDDAMEADWTRIVREGLQLMVGKHRFEVLGAIVSTNEATSGAQVDSTARLYSESGEVIGTVEDFGRPIIKKLFERASDENWTGERRVLATYAPDSPTYFLSPDGSRPMTQLRMELLYTLEIASLSPFKPGGYGPDIRATESRGEGPFGDLRLTVVEQRDGETRARLDVEGPTGSHSLLLDRFGEDAELP